MRTFLLAAALALTCASPAFADDCPEVSSVTEANNGQCISVPNGGSFTLSLQTNGGIPYRWAVTGDGSPNLSVDEGSTAPATPGRLGGGATVTFTFTAQQPGEASVAAELQSVTGGESARSVSFTVQVQGGD